MLFNELYKNKTINTLCTSTICIRNTSAWAQVPKGPADQIYGIEEAFNASKEKNKVNLSVGCYRDELGKSYVLKSVKKAELYLQRRQTDKNYIPPIGTPDYRILTAKLALGDTSPYINSGRVAVAQALSRTGATRIAMELIKAFYEGPKMIFLPHPSWPNHYRISQHTGLEYARYRYYNRRHHTLNYVGMMEDIQKMPKKSIILLHACSQNPTAIDPTLDQWNELSLAIKDRQLLCFFDLMSQGLSSGNILRDSYAVRTFIDDNNMVLFTQSYSKTMGLYGERVGACSVVTKDEQETIKLQILLKYIVKRFYSTPPIHGSQIVTSVLSDTELKTMWMNECHDLTSRIKKTRQFLKDKLYNIGSIRNWEYITKQTGTYAYLGMNPWQVRTLIKEYHIFLPPRGRIALTNVNSKNIEYIANAIHRVTK